MKGGIAMSDYNDKEWFPDEEDNEPDAIGDGGMDDAGSDDSDDSESEK